MKPIFTIGIPEIQLSELEKTSKRLSDKMPDYNVLIYRSNSECIIFNLFNSDKLEPLDIEEIKSILKAQ